ncbi:MAG: HEAT repeat domain-containing protein [Deltaproteobacteria bacterium]|jgi:HEAT repeat protein|nr:HEAT repeat domain-containing protein [Deltaproteobacteria bacterium]
MELDRIKELLASSEPDDIREGAYMAMQSGQRETVPLLVKLIEFSNPGVQEAVEAALRRIGGRVVLFSVLPLLRSEDPAVRNIAMDLLREVGKTDVVALTELLKDDDPDIRIFGADILGASGSVLALDPLCHALLRDPETNVRYQAAVSLGELGFVEAAESLGKALHDEEWVQFAVIESLTKIGDESSVAALLKAMDKSSDLVASSIVDALGKLGYIKAVPQLMKALPDASLPLANKIVCAIVNIMGPRSLSLLGANEYTRLEKFLFKALEDEDVEIQDAAIRGLASSKGDAEFEAIFDLLASLNRERDHERMVKIAKILMDMGYHPALAKNIACHHDATEELRPHLAIDIMSHIDDPAILPLLKTSFAGCGRDLQRAIIAAAAVKAGPEDKDFFTQVLDKHNDGTVIKSALYYFSRLGDAGLIVEKVLPLLDHAYDDVKESALEAAIAVHDAGINDRFREMSKDSDEVRRMMAYYALGKYSLTENLPYVENGLKDSSAEVRRVSAAAFKGACGCNMSALSLLEPLLRDESVDVRLEVIDVLGECAEPESMDLLIKASQDSDPWVRARCAENLGKKQTDAVAPCLAELLKDDQTLVVIKTIEAFVSLGGQTAFRHLLALVNHPEPEVQNVAEAALEQIRSQMGGNN